MRDPFLGHHAPMFELQVWTGRAWIPFTREYTFSRAKFYQDLAQLDYAAGRIVGPGGRLFPLWPEEDALPEHEPFDDGLGGFAPRRERTS